MHFHQKLMAVGFGAATIAAVGAAPAVAANLVTNGTLAALDYGQFDSVFIRNSNTKLTGWDYYASSNRNNGVSAVLTPGDATGAGFNDFSGFVWHLWDSSNGGTGTIPVNPPSGANNIWASDSADENRSTLGQSISGLTVGHTYEVSFNWAGAQLRYPDGSLWNGDTTDYWSVNFGGVIAGDATVTGGETHNTRTLALPEHNFTGWEAAKLRFSATATVQNLFFTSVGTPPSGAPPFALLDNVQLNAVPEPATWALLVVGFGVVGVAARRRAATTVTA